MRPRLVLILCLIAAGCKKNNSSLLSPAPIAGFATNADTTSGIITLATYDQYSLVNNSINADSFHWDFGNDSSSTLQTPVLSYPRSGTYMLSLTVKNKDGVKNTVTRKVKVLDRFMKQVLITGFNADYVSMGHSLAHANLWAVIRLGENGVSYPLPSASNQSLNAPIIYQTPVVSGADSASLPYTFIIPGKIVVDYPALVNFGETTLPGSGYSNVGYGLELYAQDAAGTYLLSSSYEFFFTTQVGAITWPVADIRRNIFTMKYGNVSVICDYE